MAYVILCKEPDIESYVLPDGAETLQSTQQLMQVRAEEFLDELAVEDIENGLDRTNGRQIEMIVSADKMSIRIFERPPAGRTEGRDLMDLSISHVHVNG